MKKSAVRRIIVITVISVYLAMSILPSITSVQAASSTVSVAGTYYELDEKSDYVYAGSPGTAISSSGKLGQFSIYGDLTSVASVNGFTAYEAKNGQISFSYVPNGSIKTADEWNWHLVEDSSKKANGIDLGSKILKGAIILQSSKDGITWITDYTQTNIAAENSTFNSSFFMTKDIQLINGCFYRVIVVYETEKRLEDTYVVGIAQHHYDNRENVEVYEFYIQDNTASVIAAGAHANTKKVIADMTNVTNTGKDNGYSGTNAIDSKDPHYGWKIGEFCLKGYTNTADYQGEEYFLKNLGDVVTLDFTLLQDIYCLNGNSKLSIAEDKNGSDQYFQVPETNFKHGTLIIRFTDFQGVKSDPIIYTDFLAAYARTGADTRVQLFEEGDYEVALDYEVKDSSGIDSYTNYRMYFTFKIRNGNNMVYAFDKGSGSQLADGKWTSSGFTIDTANSHYLTVTVDKYALVDGAGGKTLDQSWSRTASDGNSYTETGKYVVTVSNRYQPNGDVTKVFYVGNDPFIKALSVTGLSINELNEKLSQGYEIADNGTLIAPPEPEQADEETVSETTPEEVADVDADTQDAEIVVVEPASEPEQAATDDQGSDSESTDQPVTEKSGPGSKWVILIAVIAAVAGGIYFKKNKKTSSVEKTDEKPVDKPIEKPVEESVEKAEDNADADVETDTETAIDAEKETKNEEN